MSQLGHLFRRRDDPYAGADLETAKRLGGAILLLVVFIGLLITPLAPPTAAIGRAGWIVWAFVITAFVACARRFRRRAERVQANELLIVGYLALFQVGVLTWLSGGYESPYHPLLLPVTVFVAATHPPRRVGPYLPALWLTAMAPVAYDGWSFLEARHVLAELLVLTVLAVVALLLMDTVRAQRLGLRAEGERARHQARHDPGTGLLNRRALEEALDAQVAASRAAGNPLSVVVLDLDDFKAVNDEWGHVAGDECLRSVAEALSGVVRGPDSCFRWAGDEFAVLLPGARLADAARVADRLRLAVPMSCRRPDGGPLTLCHGAAELAGEECGAELLDAADRALMSAKAARAALSSETAAEGPAPDRFSL
jgi:diguanylate cyclase (GGDEF)-like protein